MLSLHLRPVPHTPSPKPPPGGPGDWITPRRKIHVEYIVEYIWHNGRKVYLEEGDRHYAELRDRFQLQQYQVEAAAKDAYWIGVIDITVPSRDTTALHLLSTDVDGAIRKLGARRGR